MKLEIENKARKKEIFGLILIFFFGVTIHFVFANFTKTIETYPDELRYYTIAKSIFSGDGISIRGIQSDFQKIAYAIFLSPFFAISNSILRIKIITFANCFVMMLSIFPIWYIGKALNLNKKYRFLIVALAVIWPDMMFTMTFMSEILYWPLFLLFIYIWILNEKKQMVKIAILEGVLCYLIYMTKEIFIAMFLAYIALEILFPWVQYFFTQKNERKGMKTYFSKRIILLTIFIVTFISCHLLLKVTLFKGMENSYNQMGIEAILQPYNFAYMLYAFIYYLAAILVAVLIIPFLYPLINFGELNEKIQRLFSLISFFLLASTATIAYTISVREDLGRIVPRIHLRYIGPAFLVLFLIFIYSIQVSTPSLINRKRRFSIELITGVLIFVGFVFKGVTRGSSVDQYLLNWYMVICEQFGNLFPINGEGKIIYVGVIVVNLLLILFIVIFHLLYTHKRAKNAIIVFSFVFVLMCTADNYAAYTLNFNSLKADETAVAEVIAIDNHFDELNENVNILYLTDGTTINKLCKYMDTYMDYNNQLFYVDSSLITDMKAKSSFLVSEKEFKEHIWDDIYPEVDSIQYIILENSTSFGINKIVNTELIPELNGEIYTVYKNLNPTEISVDINQDLCFDGNETMIVNFAGEDYNADYYILSGISHKEDGFSWTDGDSMHVEIPATFKEGKVHIQIKIAGTFNGVKNYFVRNDKMNLSTGALNGEGNIEIDASVKDYLISFDVYFPDAQIISDVIVDSSDGRKVAFRIQSMNVNTK